jgi:sugar phosphate isomerase/epimerase
MSVDRLQLAVISSALTDDPRQAPRLARGAGFAGLLFDAFSAGLNIPDLSVSGRRDFRHMLAAQDAQLAGLRVDIGPKGIGPGADVDRILARLDSVMEAAAGLGNRLICIDLGPLPAPPRERKTAPGVTAEQAGLIMLPPKPAAAPMAAALENIPQAIDLTFMAQVDGVLIDLGRRADRYGVTVALRSELASFAALERALKSADCPWYGVDLDIVSILRDEWELDEIFSRLGPLIRHVRARDALRGADRRTKPAVIGQGTANWAELLSALDSAGYHGWITIDPMELQNRTAAAVEGLEHLRDL